MNTHPSDYDTIYRNTITNIICDKFGAKRKYIKKVDSIGSNDSYDNNKDITNKMLKHCLYVR
ncbi:MAG: hypothetical protein K0S91_2656 [Nitrososphaeraceae archaeon]|jgi:hypothetical protein|nr:hypothetical protein [Nitrososphaeraceae archaeon]